MAHRTLACVFAHPDDDAYGVAGSVALHADEPDFRFILVHATVGEHGEIREGFPATRETLGAIRRAEDEAAWRALGRAVRRRIEEALSAGRLSTPMAELTEWRLARAQAGEVSATEAAHAARLADSPISG